MGDLEKDWAGVLSRWGNSSSASASSHKEVTYSSKYSSNSTSYSKESANNYSRESSYSYSKDAKVSVGSNRKSLGSLDNNNQQTVYNRQAGVERKSSSGRSTLEREKSQVFRDREERPGGKSGHRRSVSGYDASRSSISPSPAKENLENGYRSRSATRSPSSRLFSSTVSSRAKQINASMSSSNSRSVNGKQSSTSRSGSRPSSSPPLRQRSSLSRQSPRPSSTSPLQSYSDFRQVADNSGRKSSGGGKTYSSLHRSNSTASRQKKSQSESTAIRKSSGSGSVKIALSSLKKATVDGWDHGSIGHQATGKTTGKRKSISSVYIG